MIVVESFLTAIFPLLLVLGVTGYFVWRRRARIYAFFQRWYQHDLSLEEEARKQQEHRLEAEEEIKTWTAPASEGVEMPQAQAEMPQVHVEAPQVQRVGVTKETECDSK